ncbi:hypothetical protein [Lacibacter sp. H407]|uniref:hypothetical protein n=1 Tax=Lacibacter sp. H407 TaxID=3133423 RepID=UPI0030C0BEED
MKKFLFLTLIFAALISATIHAQSGPQAQGNPDPAVMLQQMKEKQVPGLVSKAGLTEAQANKVVEINLELRMTMMTDVRDLSEADRSKKIAEFKAAKEKKYSEIPLTPEQIKAVYTYYEDMGKNRQKKD